MFKTIHPVLLSTTILGIFMHGQAAAPAPAPATALLTTTHTHTHIDDAHP